MGSKAEPAATLQRTTERRPTPSAAPPWGQFHHVTSFLSGDRSLFYEKQNAYVFGESVRFV